ncbi:MAG: hypothetical protein QOJ91_3111 [Sphingomonadales bacterium]|jgi:hypothetical protein|nr:hypothetical protein [Sphingomonadales bacterium]
MVFALLSLAAVVAAPLVPGVPPAAVAVSHIEDCIAASKAGGADFALLEQRGWVSAHATVDHGKKGPFEIYTRPNDMSFLGAFGAGRDAGRCFVLLPTPAPADVAAIRTALGRPAEGPPSPPSEAAESWTVPSHRLTLVPIGNAQARGLKVTVIPLEKK